MKRVKDKIKEIKGFLADLKEMVPSGLEEYKSDKIIKAACERYAEKVIEAATDLAFLTIKYKELKIPEDDIDAFNILRDNKIINSELAARLGNAKGMRNIIAHQYGKIKDELVFNSITQELGKDVNSFISRLQK